jgi:molecular chaperone DnaK
MLGVPAAAFEFEVDLASGGVTAVEPMPSPRPPPAASTPPPVPRTSPRTGASTRSGPVHATAQLPTLSRPPEPPAHRRPPAQTTATQPTLGAWEDVPAGEDAPGARGSRSARDVPAAAEDWTGGDSSTGTDPAAWLTPGPPYPATTLPLSPAPAAAPTLVAVDYAAASRARGPQAQTIIGDAPAITAKGFRAPQSIPVQPMPVAPPPRLPPVVLEVTPRGLGIATVAGYCEELIRRNARLPAETRKLFTTSRDHQDQVRIVVCQGESRRLDSNTVIGDLVLQNLPRRPRGETSIEVTFSLDASGILNVRARDAETGVEQRATLDLVGGVAQDDVASSRDRLQQLRR